MSAESVEVAAQAETPAAAEQTENVASEPKPVEEQPAETAPVAPVVEAAQPEGEPVEPEQQQEQQQEPERKPDLTREEFARIADEFGDSIAVRAVRDGLDFYGAQALAYRALKAEVAELRESRASQNGRPAVVVEARDPKKGKLFNTGK